ncbi:DUF5682 family protein [Parafrankia discariae]|uniref:DUF5682 family protein n=1 Tax=Parafrankia discariae TaxID=365528 RepID=UPI00036676AD|nr:DUF5682 family protein [Parafrankia discariae]
MSVTVLGIRHHGPGSARAVEAALAELDPDLVLVEGPAEGDAALAHTGSLTPPVALTVYARDEPRDAAFWPFAEFSPEWRALLHGAATGVPVRFMDLPFGLSLALRRQEQAEAEAEAATTDAATTGADTDTDTTDTDTPAYLIEDDPLGWLARAAGHDDPERFWEDLVEHRRLARVAAGEPARDGALALFAAVADAMAGLRDEAGPSDPTSPARAEHRRREEMREAHMRLEIRRAGSGPAAATRIAVVCGAWHVPALTGALGRTSATADQRTLRGVRAVRTDTTWVPWTHARLAAESGYGAGVASPGWYHHLWTARDQVTTRWVTRVAGLLRAADLPASSASVIETVRLAEALAAVRERAVPGLTELNDAVLAGLCGGDQVPLAVVREQLVVGRVLGAVGADVPTVPLAADLARLQRRLRLRPAADDQRVRLDLRKDVDRERGQLLRRLRLLDVPWGTPAATSGTGTFAEAWTLRWEPEFSVAVVAAARYGSTVADAATAVIAERTRAAADLPAVTALLEAAVLAGLPAAMAVVAAGLERRAAGTGDVAHLMAALAPLARIHRYGDVRATDTTGVTALAVSLMVRICAGLPPACVSLGDDAADAMANAIDSADGAFRLIADPGHVERWHDAVRAAADVHGADSLVNGRCVRILADAGDLDQVEVARRLDRALSAAGVAPAAAARWLEGFLGSTGSVLARDPRLLGLVDAWLASLTAGGFTAVLAPLRRVFAAFTAPERRMIAERARSGLPRPGGGTAGESTGPATPTNDPAAGGPAVGDPAAWDTERVTLVLPVVAALLAIPGPERTAPHD